MRSKKGFTLAELLIVVAIIAVLVAIAVPLFIGALSNAQTARDNANIRAVRSAAVVMILETDKSKDTTHKAYKTDGTLYGFYTAVATIDSTGNFVSSIDITGADADPDTDKKGGKVEAGTTAGQYKVTAYLTSQDLSGVSAGAGAGA